MAVPVNEATKRAIRVVVDTHRAGPFAWGSRDCLTLAEGVLGAQGIVVDFRAMTPEVVADTHKESVLRCVRKFGTMEAMLVHHLDRVPGLERADSPFEWEAGMVGITPQEGEFCVGLSKVDARSYCGSTLGVVCDRVVARGMMPDRGLQTVSKLWPRWKKRHRLATGE